jgi:MSHA biogenesis protein MshJ
MTLPPIVEQYTARFDALSIRERVLVTCALLAAVVMLWMLAIQDPISGKARALAAEKTSLEEQIAAAKAGIESTTSSDPTTLALAEEKKVLAELEQVNGQLASKSAGLIPPERMVQVIHDVLSRQHGVTLVSLHNKPVTGLVKDVPPAATSAPSEASVDEGAEAPAETTADTADAYAPAESTGPFVHPVELVIEGSYLDVLAYLKALEALEWRFHWKVLDLETQHYPVNRVRIELSTLSMDKDWIGV